MLQPLYPSRNKPTVDGLMADLDTEVQKRKIYALVGNRIPIILSIVTSPTSELTQNGIKTIVNAGRF
jgi:hypothetical protein